ncbi:hypothetical protein HPB49_017402 [Dermacentor silvarum]|uniref:Uncharacterized protein n=1 Tax=Dermacentor silvarum TaxID=543639 RepID=A0ACB8CAI5_DERSI|nr:uncharacterized protein LOC119462131 [Dermacentor silvarum]KAH7937908.1 hypothetical protein HPB49_017402 [Dermacentor silvarum]
MPRDRYKALSNGTPTEARAIPKPFGTAAYQRRLREITVRITRNRTLERPSHREDDDDGEAPILNKERNCRHPSSLTSSASTSSPKYRAGTRYDPPSDIEPSPSWTPKGFLVFVDSSTELENERQRERAVVPPEDSLFYPASPEEAASTGDVDADPARGGSPPKTGCFHVTASSGSPACRICHEGDREESLVSLCKCSGAAGLLHASCLERWMNARNVEHCEVCHHRFQTAAVESSSARLFFRWVLFGEPQMQRALLGDLLLFALLTPVAVLSCLLCVRGASKRALRGDVTEAAGLAALAVLLIAACVVWSCFAVRVHRRAFVAWKARHDPMQRTVVTPPFQRKTSARTTSPRELVDVATGNIDVDTTSTRRQDGGGNCDVDHALFETSANALSEDLPSELQQSVGSARKHSARSGSIV